MYNNGRSVTILRPEDDFYPLCLIFNQEGANLWVEYHPESSPSATMIKCCSETNAEVRQMCQEIYGGYLVVQDGHEFNSNFIKEEDDG